MQGQTLPYAMTISIAEDLAGTYPPAGEFNPKSHKELDGSVVITYFGFLIAIISDRSGECDLR